MKTKHFGLLFLVITLFSCEKQKYDLTFENQADVTINVSNDYFDSFSINPGEVKTVKSEWDFVYYVDFTHSATDKVIDYKKVSDDYLLFYQYDFLVQYRITGTASSVDVTLNNSSGGTSQYSNVSLPVTYDYKTFSDGFVYVSAQNQGETGSVTVEIYHKGKKIKSSTSSGAYVIATASGSI